VASIWDETAPCWKAPARPTPSARLKRDPKGVAPAGQRAALARRQLGEPPEALPSQEMRDQPAVACQPAPQVLPTAAVSRVRGEPPEAREGPGPQDRGAQREARGRQDLRARREVPEPQEAR
jgi:hypothetical protein